MFKAHIFYKGMVQGVGFRYTTERFAKMLGLYGWVKNLVDGRVEIIVEGEKEKIERLCEQLSAHFGSYIQDVSISYSENLEDFTDFQIRK